MCLSANFITRYGPRAAVLGIETNTGKQFARSVAQRGLGVVLLSDDADAASTLADEIRREHKVEVSAAVISDAFTSDPDVGLLIVSTRVAEVARDAAQRFVAGRTRGGVLLVTFMDGASKIAAELKKDNGKVDVLQLNPRKIAPGTLRARVDRCLGQLGENSHYHSSTQEKLDVATEAACIGLCTIA